MQLGAYIDGLIRSEDYRAATRQHHASDPRKTAVPEGPLAETHLKEGGHPRSQLPEFGRPSAGGRPVLGNLRPARRPSCPSRKRTSRHCVRPTSCAATLARHGGVFQARVHSSRCHRSRERPLSRLHSSTAPRQRQPPHRPDGSSRESRERGRRRCGYTMADQARRVPDAGESELRSRLRGLSRRRWSNHGQQRWEGGPAHQVSAVAPWRPSSQFRGRR